MLYNEREKAEQGQRLAVLVSLWTVSQFLIAAFRHGVLPRAKLLEYYMSSLNSHTSSMRWVLFFLLSSLILSKGQARLSREK